ITSDANLYASGSSASINTYDSCVTPIFKPSASIMEPLSPIIEPLSSIIDPLSSNIKPLSSTIKPLSPIIASSSNSTKFEHKSLDIDLVSDTKDINDKKLWPNSTTKSLLVYLSDHMKDYQFKKNQFYVKAALYLGKGKTGSQVASKIRWLINKYMKESTNKTGKGVSKWEFFMEMNEIFSNRKNVHPNYLIDSTEKVSKNIEQPEKDHSLKRKKCSKLSKDDKIYIQSMTTISESKILSAKTKQQQFDLKKEKLQFEREKFEHQK
ncbi:25134_t:CDS:2, partial [Gigaspora margarita]